MTQKKIALAISGIVLVSIIGYFIFLKKQADKLLEMTYSFQKFKVQNAGLSNFKFSIEVVLNNPTKVDFTISGYDIDIAFQDTPITKIKGSELAILVPANQSVAIPLAVEFDPRKLGTNILQAFLDIFILNSREIAGNNLKFTGMVSGKFGAVGFKNVPIDYTYAL
jgi:hypothetical protein